MKKERRERRRNDEVDVDDERNSAPKVIIIDALKNYDDKNSSFVTFSSVKIISSKNDESFLMKSRPLWDVLVAQTPRHLSFLTILSKNVMQTFHHG